MEAINPGEARLSRQPLLLCCLRPFSPELWTDMTTGAAEDGGEPVKPLQRTLRPGPQGQTLRLTPGDVVFRCAPLPPLEPGELLVVRAGLRSAAAGESGVGAGFMPARWAGEGRGASWMSPIRARGAS